ncbi:hypothetical protein [Phaeacidiphilus oryzae]|uniref:hypothetical protein n=1 Tax=Phaeacidiphilus oryzae TaxID=348818 RepID=UPI00126A2A6E|nr:hypothetical protein [Phaeacidiphilus oryzae]
MVHSLALVSCEKTRRTRASRSMPAPAERRVATAAARYSPAPTAGGADSHAATSPKASAGSRPAPSTAASTSAAYSAAAGVERRSSVTYSGTRSASSAGVGARARRKSSRPGIPLPRQSPRIPSRQCRASAVRCSESPACSSGVNARAPRTSAQSSGGGAASVNSAKIRRIRAGRSTAPSAARQISAPTSIRGSPKASRQQRKPWMPIDTARYSTTSGSSAGANSSLRSRSSSSSPGTPASSPSGSVCGSRRSVSQAATKPSVVGSGQPVVRMTCSAGGNQKAIRPSAISPSRATSRARHSGGWSSRSATVRSWAGSRVLWAVSQSATPSGVVRQPRSASRCAVSRASSYSSRAASTASRRAVDSGARSARWAWVRAARAASTPSASPASASWKRFIARPSSKSPG